MTSAINSGPINVNYPVAGVNNSTQPFRDNFASIANNFNIAGSEISDLQNKGIFKAALVGSTLNNDMANAKISNALIQGFRASTFDLGTNLANTIVIDVTNGDVQYGTITANAQLQFAKWAPTGTQSNVQVILTVANASAVLNLPTNVVYGLDTIQNYLGNGSPGGNIAMPSDETQVQYTFSTLDCGTTLTISPTNIPRQTKQVYKRIVTAQIGRLGDRAGDVAIGAGFGVGSITVNSGGTGYTVAPTVTIARPDVDGGTRATATAQVAAGVITGYTITTTGSGYLRPPVVTITGSGNGAVATSVTTSVPNYMYFCTNDYNGSTLIWNKAATQSW